MKDQLSRLRKGLAFGGICGAGFLAFLDFTVVNTALPVIQKQLAMSLVSLQWVLNIYLLVLAVFMMVAGRLGDIYGHRRIFYIGAITFIIASLIAGLADHGTTLIFGRFLQAIGAAILFPLAASLLIEAFPHDSTKVLSLYGAIGGVGLAIGPLLGAFLTTYVGWRYLFFINIPIGILSLVACLFSIPPSKVETRIKMDWWGLIFFMLSIGCLILGVIRSAAVGLVSFSTLALFSISIMAFLLFRAIEGKVENPLVDLAIVAKPLFLLGAFANMMGGVASCIGLFFLPLYLHTIANISVLNIGLILSSITVVYIVASMTLHRLEKACGLVNTLVFGIATGVISAVLDYYLTLSSSAYLVILPCVFIGLTWAVGNTLAVVAAHQAVTSDKMGVATGMVYTLFNIGGSIALALATVVFEAIEKAKFQVDLQHINLVLTANQQTMVQHALVNPLNSQALLQSFGLTMTEVLTIVKHSFISGFYGAVTVMLGISLLILFASLAIAK